MREEQYHSPLHPSRQLLWENKTAQSKTLQMFPLKKSGSQCIRRKITTGAGTTALNGDIDSNGSITPLLGRAAGKQAVHSVSDNVRTTRRVSPRRGSVPGAGAGRPRSHQSLPAAPGTAWRPPAGAGVLCPGSPAPGHGRCWSPTHEDLGRAARSSGAAARGCQRPGVTAALRRDAKTRSQWVLGACPPAPGRPAVQQLGYRRAPRSPAPAHQHCPARSLRHLGSAPARLRLRLSACSAHRHERFQLPAAAAQPRPGGTGRKQLLFLTCLISTLPHQHASAPRRLGGSAGRTSAPAGTHLSPAARPAAPAAGTDTLRGPPSSSFPRPTPPKLRGRGTPLLQLPELGQPMVTWPATGPAIKPCCPLTSRRSSSPALWQGGLRCWAGSCSHKRPQEPCPGARPYCVKSTAHPAQDPVSNHATFH